MSYLLIHNGNVLVKSWAASYFNCQILPCFGDIWNINGLTISHANDKLKYLSSANFCTDAMLSESEIDLWTIKSDCKIIKILTSFQRDKQYLDPAWQNYDHVQWLRNSFFGLSVADEIIFLDDIDQSSALTAQDTIVLSPGRCGTHLLKDLLEIETHLHHNDDILTSPRFQTILSQRMIYSIMRKNFHEQAVSDAIARDKGGMMLTYPWTLDLMKTKVKTWSNITFTEEDALNTWLKMTSFADLLLGIRILYNKSIKFYFMENFQPYFNQTDVIKNPYNKKNLISNYQQSVDICKKYQPLYEQCINNIVQYIGLSVYTP